MKIKDNKIIKIVVVVLIVLFLVLGVIGLSNKNEIQDDVVISYSEEGIPKFIDGAYTMDKIRNSEEALKSLETLKSDMGFTDAQKEFVLESEEVNDGITYYKFSQLYKGIPVYGNEIIISVSKDNEILSLSGYYLPNINVDIDNIKEENEIKEVVLSDLGDNAQILDIIKYIYEEENNELVVFLVKVSNDDKAFEYVVNASTGEIVSKSDIMDYTAYEFSGNGARNQIETVTIDEYYDTDRQKTKYRLVDPIRNIEIVDASSIGTDLGGIIISGLYSSNSPMIGDLDGNNFKYKTGENEDKKIALNGITTLKTFEEIYDYYNNVLGRKSYDNKGAKIVVNIGVKESTFGSDDLQNAAWLSVTNQMYIGEWNGVSFGVSKDVLAHELTHGVISRVANFASSPKRKDKDKAFETGSLNEGIADILGSLIEGQNWTISESIETLRDLENPLSYNNPKEKGGEFYFPDGYLSEERTLEEFLKDNNLSSVSSYDGGGKHHNSTVVSHAAYLMEANGAIKNKEQLAKLWYNSLFLMTSYSNFEDCALAVIKTAKNMGLSSSSVEKIREAFFETKMLERKDESYKVSGKVTSGSKELSNIKVTIKSEKDNKVYTSITNSKGVFEVKELPSGKYVLEINDKDYKSYKKNLNVVKDVNEKVDLEKINNSTSDEKCFFSVYEEGEFKHLMYRSEICGTDLVFPSEIDGHKIEKVPDYFSGVGDITSLTISEGIKEIGNGAFSLSHELSKVSLPGSLERIGDYAFADCKITSVNFGENLISIGEHAFINNKLTKLNIPDNVKTIGVSAFSKNKLKEVRLSENLEIIEAGTFNNNELTSVVIPHSVKIIGESAFDHNRLVNITIGMNVTKIEEGAFKDALYYREGATEAVIEGVSGNGTIEKIINKSGNAFLWEEILGGSAYTESKGSFVTGTYRYTYTVKDSGSNESILKSKSIEITN